MPGFFEGLRRMMTGKDVFQPTDQPRRDLDAPVIEYNDELTSPTGDGVVVDERKKSGVKEYPQVVIDRFECYLRNGGRMEINLFLRNQFHDKIWVERVMLFGHTYNVEHELSPGEVREFPIYRGMTLDNKAYTHAEVHYRTVPNGDYFAAMHMVDFQEQPDRRYVPHRMRFYGPVKDI